MRHRQLLAWIEHGMPSILRQRNISLHYGQQQLHSIRRAAQPNPGISFCFLGFNIPKRRPLLLAPDNELRSYEVNAETPSITPDFLKRPLLYRRVLMTIANPVFC